MADQNEFKRIGAGWKKTSKNGNTYLSLKFDAEAIGGLDLSQMNVMIFPSKQKQTPKSPDYTVSAIAMSGFQKPQQNQRQAQPPSQNFAPNQSALDDGDDF